MSAQAPNTDDSPSRSMTTSDSEPKEKVSFFSLPTELRLLVYAEYFSCLPIEDTASEISYPPLLITHSTIRKEALQDWLSRLNQAWNILEAEQEALDEETSAANIESLQIAGGFADLQRLQREASGRIYRRQSVSARQHELKRQTQKAESDLEKGKGER